MNGTIKKLHTGYGFILGSDRKEYFFHYSALLDDVHFEELSEGREVEFEDSIGKKGPRAEQVRLV